MNEDKKSLRGITPEQEDALESVSGGQVQFTKPVFDPSDDSIRCPVCGGELIIYVFSDNAHCSSCGRWFHYDGVTLEEK